MGEALASRQQVKTKAEIAEMSNSLPGQLNTHFSVYWYIHVKHLFVSKRNSFGGFRGNELGYFNKKKYVQLRNSVYKKFAFPPFRHRPYALGKYSIKQQTA